MEHDKIAHQQELRKVVKCKDQIIDDLKQTNVKLQGHVSQSSAGHVRFALYLYKSVSPLHNWKTIVIC